VVTLAGSRSIEFVGSSAGRSIPRLSPRAYRRITLVALVVVSVIVVSGAAVRLTGSGLGCTDWPTCQQNRLVAPVEYHAMVEFVNRTFTGVLSIAVILAVLGSLVRTPRRSDLTWWSLGLVAGIVGQIVLGGLTVLFELKPPFVMGHFLLSMLIVWNAVVLHERAAHERGPGTLVVPAAARTLGRLMVAAASVTLLAGTVVTGTGPHGGDDKVERLGFDISSVARLHAISAFAFLGLTLYSLWMVHRSGAPRAVELRARVLAIAIVAQMAVGYTQYFTGVPPGLVLLHVLGSVAVWIAVLAYYLALERRPLELGDAVARPAETAAAAP